MISIRNTMAEMETLHQLRTAALDCYVAALRNIAHYAVALDDALTGPFRKHVEALAAEVALAEPPIVEDSKSTLRALLREYRDRAAQFLEGLRGDLGTATTALNELMVSFSQSDVDHDVRLRTSLKDLRTACEDSPPEALRNLVSTTADHIESSLEELRRQHQVTITQFQMEVRALHKRIDALESAVSIGKLALLLTRGEIEKKLASAPIGVSLLLIRVSGIRYAETQFDHDVAAELAGAFTRRLRNTLEPNAEIGRWSTEEFVAILNVSKPEAIALAKWIAEHLSGSYSCVQQGRAVRPSLQLSLGVVEHNGEPVEKVIARIGEFLNIREQTATTKSGTSH